jgi:hypothetical protein
MQDGERSEPTELIPLSRSSVLPIGTALGLALVAVGLFAGLVYTIVGAVVLVISVLRWLRASRTEVARLPVDQRQASATLRPRR